MAFGQPAGGGRRAHRAAGVVDGEALPGGEPVQAAHGDHGAGRRARGERRMLVVAPRSGARKSSTSFSLHVAQVGQPARRAGADVAAQVTAVRRQVLRREAALDHQVVVVGGDDRAARAAAAASALGCAPALESRRATC